ncbi:MAG: response regulator [Phycisphaerae bacterium]|nr:response regulator [Phycisphaerae bacterium]
MANNVLFVDDDPAAIAIFKAGLKGRFDVETADSGPSGLDLLAEKGPFAVVVADIFMPGMDGIEFLSVVRDRAPDTVRMMLSGKADLTTAIDAVNKGRIFRFLTKPCPKDTLIESIEAGVRQYELITAERMLLENTLSDSVQILTDMLSMVNPVAFSRAARVRRYVVHIAKKLGLSDIWQFDMAAMLSQIGCATLPPQMLERAYGEKELTPNEQEMFTSHPEAASKLIAEIPRLEKVADMIARQQAPFNDDSAPDAAPGDDTSILGGRILKVALAFDASLEQELPAMDAIDRLRKQPDTYDPQIVEALVGLDRNRQGNVPRSVSVLELEPGMVIDEDVYTKKNRYVMMKGQVVTATVLTLLRTYARTVGIKEPIRVLA